MMNDAMIRNKGMKVLIEHLGKVEAERFITLIIREPFDYTEWQDKLWDNKTVKEISEEAMGFRDEL